jgi:hypothetical protein
MEPPRSGYRHVGQIPSSRSKRCFEVELPGVGHNQALQQPAAAILEARSSMSHSAAAELSRYAAEPFASIEKYDQARLLHQ